MAAVPTDRGHDDEVDYEDRQLREIKRQISDLEALER